jgi:hypothetical protein
MTKNQALKALEGVIVELQKIAIPIIENGYAQDVRLIQRLLNTAFDLKTRLEPKMK